MKTKDETSKIVESSADAPDSIATVPNTNTFVKSRQRTSFKEFALRKNLRPEIKAGFRVWLQGKLFFFDEEWEQKFNEYLNRKI